MGTGSTPEGPVWLSPASPLGSPLVEAGLVSTQRGLASLQVSKGLIVDFAEGGSGLWLGYPAPQGAYGLWVSLIWENIGSNSVQEKVLNPIRNLADKSKGKTCSSFTFNAGVLSKKTPPKQREQPLKAKFLKVRCDCSQAGFHHTLPCYKRELVVHFGSEAVSLVSSLPSLSSPCWQPVVGQAPPGVALLKPAGFGAAELCAAAIPHQFYHRLPQTGAATSPRRPGFPLWCYRDSRRGRKRRKEKILKGGWRGIKKRPQCQIAVQISVKAVLI